MQLKYAQDIKWQDLERVENPFFASATIRQELSRPSTTLRGGFGMDKNPLDQLRRPGRNDIDQDLLKQFYKDVAEGRILLIHDFAVNQQRQAFEPVADDGSSVNKRWKLKDGLSNAGASQLEEVIQQVRQPHSPGAIVAPVAVASLAPLVQSAKSKDVSEETYSLCYQFQDENGQPIAKLPYKTALAGESVKQLHIADSKTSQKGKTAPVSTTQNEEIDLYIVWAKLQVNTDFLKM